MDFSIQDNWSDFPSFSRHKIAWKKSAPNTSHVAYEAIVENRSWRLRMNDFPDEPLYTLIVNGVEIIHFNDWPSDWTRES